MEQEPITRRRALQALAAAGITGPLALDVLAQSRGRITVETVRQAAAILGEEFSAERAAVVEKALQRNLDHNQLLRDLVIDDHVEPAPMFVARRDGASSSPASPRPQD